mmetsp:Transcript_123447/g.348805  ORF Transcript_123447/g.348805 Transcript_123447/m.348805 type:complete len:260 (+) Transcript_123447:986-1765(+)
MANDTHTSQKTGNAFCRALSFIIACMPPPFFFFLPASSLMALSSSIEATKSSTSSRPPALMTCLRSFCRPTSPDFVAMSKQVLPSALGTFGFDLFSTRKVITEICDAQHARWMGIILELSSASKSAPKYAKSLSAVSSPLYAAQCAAVHPFLSWALSSESPPRCMRSRKAEYFLCWRAIIRGVAPRESWTVKDAFASTNIRAVRMWPRNTAHINEVCLLLASASTGTPLANNVSTKSLQPTRAAQCKKVCPSSSRSVQY